MRSMCVTVAMMTAAGVWAGFAAEGPAAQDATNTGRLNPQIAALGDGQSVQLKTSEPTAPGRGYSARMPYDPVNKVGLVYGSCHNPGSIAQNDVWMFDAATATWAELVKTDPRSQALRYKKEVGKP